jgi:hypothetical protein
MCRGRTDVQGRRRGRLAAGWASAGRSRRALIGVLAVAVVAGAGGAASPAGSRGVPVRAAGTTAVTASSTALTNPALYDLQAGSLNEKADGSFTAAASVTKFLSPSTGFQSLDSPYTYAIPAGTAFVRWVIAYSSFTAITPADHSPWLSVTASTGTATTAVTDPAFADYEQGTIASGTGADEDAGNSEGASRIRIAAPAAVDSSWQTLQFANATDASLQITIFAYAAPAAKVLALPAPASVGPSLQALQFADPNPITDANFARTYYIEVLPYDADGNFLGRTSGWHLLDATPFVYALPPHTAKINYELEYLDGDPISPSDQASWVTITPAAAPPSWDYYQLHDQPIAPEFTIPGLAGAQTAAWVNGELWDAGSSSTDNEVGGPPAPADGTMDVWDINWKTHAATLAHQFKNNFGHLNAWGWSPLNNDMIIGNGGTDYTNPPAFYVVPVKNIDLDGTNTLASTGAIIYTVPAGFGDRPGMTWTGTPNVAIMDTDSGTTIRKIRLDTGTSQGHYGTYQAAAAGQYNGTFDVLDTYHLDDSLGGSLYPQSGSYPDQDPVWVKGNTFLLGVGDGNTMAIGVITLGDHGKMTYTIYHDDNNYADFQGVFYDPKDGYMGGLTDAGTPDESLYVWHASNWTWTPVGPGSGRPGQQGQGTSVS